MRCGLAHSRAVTQHWLQTASEHVNHTHHVEGLLQRHLPKAREPVGADLQLLRRAVWVGLQRLLQQQKFSETQLCRTT